jgi:hypothetical protein
MDKIYWEGFCLLLPSTQRRITGAIYRLCSGLAPALERDNLTYGEFVRLVVDFDEKIPWAISGELAADLFPANVVKDSSAPDFSSIDSEEKLEANLLSAPEPSPEALEMALKEIDGALPYLRELLITHGKKLPHDRGGAPRKLGTPQEQEKIREEVKTLRGPGTKLTDIYARIAQRHGVSASKIKQIWLNRPK